MEGEGLGAESPPDRLDEWIDRRAAELGTDRRGVLARAVVALRTLEEGDDGAPVDPDRPDDRVSRLETAVDAEIDDVRERVVQVKRETDAKADADHDHPDLRESAAAARAEASAAADRAENAAAAATAVDDRTAAGFENFEEVLSYLRDATDENEAKLDAAVRAVLDLRARVRDLEAAAARREAAVDIRAEANRRGVAAARCESCGASVSLGLLDHPACPDCGVAFDGLGPDPGLFRKPVLTAGEPSALAAVPNAPPDETPADPFDPADAPAEGVASDADAAPDSDDGTGRDADSEPGETATGTFAPDATEGDERGE